MRARAWLLGAALLAGCGSAERAEDHLKKGTALNAEGKYDAAVTELTRAVAASRDSVEAQTQLGNAYRGLKQYDKAFEAYRAAKKIDRLRLEPHLENGRALVEAGQIDQAIDQLNHVIELDSKNVQAMLLLGQVSMMERPLPEGGRGVPRASLERAELNFQSAVQLAPDNAEARRGLAEARDRLARKAP